VRSYYHALSILASYAGYHFSWKLIWRVKAHSIVVFFEWTTALGKIFTLDKLRKRNVIVVDWCCMCKKGEEFIDHLLHCEVARELWSSHFHLFCADWVMPRRVRELLMSWRGRVGSRNILEVWRLTPLYLMWCIWRKWNARNFEDRETPAVELKNNMFKSLYT
jgi:hypothetical protein